ncbi:diphthamide biosynthesis protein [Trametes gibbosa]|nr:diphthamide biosynthesis protein [Trametes gibbosa]
MAEVTTFSSSGEDAITRTINLHEDVPSVLSEADYDITFDVARTVEEIERGDYKRIALQFPDEFLPHSVPIFKALKLKIAPSRELYVLADTTYGSCCVDEVAAQHVDADALVHYGHACMSQTSRLPVIYVLCKKTVDPAHCASNIQAILRSSALSSKTTVVLRYDVAYAHRAADEIVAELKLRQPSCKILHTTPQLSTQPPSDKSQRPAQSQNKHTGDCLLDPVEDASQLVGDASPEESLMFYVGGESLTLTNLMLTHASYEIYSYNPATRETRQESSRTNKLLMRRYAVVQKARDADVIGILVGTLGVANYLPLIKHLRNVINKAHKKSYTITVGKPNPAKLANFLEIECFVLVACPENSLLESKQFLRPIITPYELEVALQPTQSWTGRYVLDFDQLLREHADAVQNPDVSEGEQDDLDQPVFSLVTGKYRHAQRYGGSDEPSVNGKDSSAIILRNQDNTLARLDDSAAAKFLQSRIFQGLEPRVGEDVPSVLEQGRSGIARGYADDHGDDDS